MMPDWGSLTDCSEESEPRQRLVLLVETLLYYEGQN